ncbi:bifunctional sugar-1-phosphate nucleotidylyltransferase/acetyltransferase [Ignicoccus hospitalis]|uniref:bifunctional sugar-1-phosphate nucleotidylyltransferase/acetyltransferase n=1 Tax=Ignicoccus hospitalis TaxID=160233 RepID=UPI001930C98F|nr:bifunctional sugar-1-phosphate nucleotidylyltransferase/acetyltransferase [Ignicoccus hospitalis]
MRTAAVLLAAGKGERMWPLTSTRPKPLLPVALGESLLERWIKALKEITEDIIVVVNKEHVKYFENLRSEYGVELAVQIAAPGTGAALASVKPPEADYVVVAYADVYLQRPLLELKRLLAEAPSVLAVRVDDVSQYGALVVENGEVREVIEKEMSGPGLINGGVYVFSKEIFELLKELKPSKRGEYELTDLVKGLRAVEVASGWKDVGRPWDIFDVMKMEFEVREGLENPWGPGKVYGELPEVKGEVYVEGPVYFGEGVVLGPFAHVRPYVALLDGVKVGPFVQVKESMIMEGSRLPHLNYVGDSVVAEDVNFGAGSVTANLRFDEREVEVTLKGQRVSTGRRKLGAIVGGGARIGVNVSLMPGTRVGARSWIYPGCVVRGDVPDGARYKC